VRGLLEEDCRRMLSEVVKRYNVVGGVNCHRVLREMLLQCKWQGVKRY
jgi:tRNA A37 threonylcarbamoyltransferase TsaD